MWKEQGMWDFLGMEPKTNIVPGKWEGKWLSASELHPSLWRHPFVTGEATPQSLWSRKSTWEDTYLIPKITKCHIPSSEKRRTLRLSEVHQLVSYHTVALPPSQSRPVTLDYFPLHFTWAWRGRPRLLLLPFITPYISPKGFLSIQRWGNRFEEEESLATNLTGFIQGTVEDNSHSRLRTRTRTQGLWNP